MIIWLLVAPAISCHGVLLRSCAQVKGSKAFKSEADFNGRVSSTVKVALDREAGNRVTDGPKPNKATPLTVFLPTRKASDPAFTEFYNELLDEARWAAQVLELLCESDQLFLATPMAARASIRGLSLY
jgi:hypothetical protein